LLIKVSSGNKQMQQGFAIAVLIATGLLSACVSRPAGETRENGSSEKIDWGRETTAGEIVAMAKKGEIREIQWHVMPNVLRAEAADGRIFHIKNENKGIDLRSMLIDAGVRVGNGGVSFRHVF